MSSVTTKPRSVRRAQCMDVVWTQRPFPFCVLPLQYVRQYHDVTHRRKGTSVLITHKAETCFAWSRKQELQPQVKKIAAERTEMTCAGRVYRGVLCAARQRHLQIWQRAVADGLSVHFHDATMRELDHHPSHCEDEEQSWPHAFPLTLPALRSSAVIFRNRS